MTLTEFLLARFAEDGRGDWLTCPDCGASGARCESYKADGKKCCPDCHHPARVLDECEAKCRLVQTMQTALDQAWQDGPMRPVIEHLAQRSLRLLALPYADHPDYDPDWRI